MFTFRKTDPTPIEIDTQTLLKTNENAKRHALNGDFKQISTDYENGASVTAITQGLLQGNHFKDKETILRTFCKIPDIHLRRKIGIEADQILSKKRIYFGIARFVYPSECITDLKLKKLNLNTNQAIAYSDKAIKGLLKTLSVREEENEYHLKLVYKDLVFDFPFTVLSTVISYLTKLNAVELEIISALLVAEKVQQYQKTYPDRKKKMLRHTKELTITHVNAFDQKHLTYGCIFNTSDPRVQKLKQAIKKSRSIEEIETALVAAPQQQSSVKKDNELSLLPVDDDFTNFAKDELAFVRSLR